MSTEPNENIQSETIVVTTEQGVVLTGTRVEAFEARIIKAIRRPFHMTGLLQGFLFVMLIGLGVILGNLSSTANSTDRIVKNATSPEAQAQQGEVIKQLLTGINCQDQKNLQKLVDSLVAAGSQQLRTLPSLIDPSCIP